MSRWCDQSIHDAGHSESPHGLLSVAKLFGTLVAETILASVHVRAHQQAGHMDASDLIKTLQNTLRGGGRPHMGGSCRHGKSRLWSGKRLKPVANPRTERIDHRRRFRPTAKPTPSPIPTRQYNRPIVTLFSSSPQSVDSPPAHDNLVRLCAHFGRCRRPVVVCIHWSGTVAEPTGDPRRSTLRHGARA